MKLNLDTVVSNLVAVLSECQAVKMQNTVPVQAEVWDSSPVGKVLERLQ